MFSRVKLLARGATTANAAGFCFGLGGLLTPAPAAASPYATSNPAKALLAYTRAAAYHGSEKYAYALYKLAWCYENVGEHDRALERMARAVEAAREAGQGDVEARAAADLTAFAAAAR